MSAEAPAVPARARPPEEQKERRAGRLARRGLLHLGLALVSLSMAVPFFWMIITSLKSEPEIARHPPTLIPHAWKWSNYSEMLDLAPFDIYFKNSLIISIGHTSINLALASMAGYALARVPFRGRTVLFLGVLGTMMIPTYAKLIPQYLIAKGMPFFGGNDYLGRGGNGWLDSWWALIVPGALTPFAIFLFRQFYLSLPKELEEAARVDGLGEFGIYARVMTPLVKPAIATVALLTFEESWNNFLWPLIVTQDSNLRVIQVGLTSFQQADQTAWGFLMAGTTLATVPMILLFVFTQRYFVAGLVNTGIK